jgi:transcriptional antiterminator NusG
MGSFERGERVRINDGVFLNFAGVVEDVNVERQTLTVSLVVFSRAIAVELRFTQVRKLA